MIRVLRHQHVRQQTRSRQPARDRPARRRCLHDALARRAAQLRPHMPDHLEARRHVLQHLGNIFAQRTQRAAAIGTDLLLRVHASASRAADVRAAAAVPVSRGARVSGCRLVMRRSRASAACFASRSSSRSSSCSICRSSFSERRPNCIRRSLAISSFRCSISLSREKPLVRVAIRSSCSATSSACNALGRARSGPAASAPACAEYGTKHR